MSQAHRELPRSEFCRQRAKCLALISLLSCVCVLFRRGLLGIQHQVKEKKKRAAKQKDDTDIGPVASAERLLDTKGEESTMTDKRVQRMWEALPEQFESLFDVMLHPHSFCQSIENIFDLTFLIKKGQAEVRIDEEFQIPVVRKIEMDADAEVAEEGSAAARDAEKSFFQCIIKLDEAKWAELVDAFDLRRKRGGKPWLKDRASRYAADAAQAAAYSAANASPARVRASVKRGRVSGSAGSASRAAAVDAADAADSVDAAAAAADADADADANADADAYPDASQVGGVGGANFVTSSQQTMEAFITRKKPSLATTSDTTANKRRRRSEQQEERKHQESEEEDAED